MRLAIVGKGGTGKSVICGTLARILARRGHKILALDMDTVPGLAMSLGLSTDKVGAVGLPEGLAERKPKKGWVLNKGVTIQSLVAEHATIAPDDVRFLQLGKLPGGVRPESTAAFWHVLQRFNKKGWDVLIDLAAGTRQPFFGWGNSADTILVLVEPSAKSLLAARRLVKLAMRPKGKGMTREPLQPKMGLVANKLRSRDDLKFIRKAMKASKMFIATKIAYDEDLIAAEQAGKALIDYQQQAAAVAAIEKLADWLVANQKSEANGKTERKTL